MEKSNIFHFFFSNSGAGYGWLTIVFTTAFGKYLPNSGRPCDPAFSPCDLYVEVLIDDQHVYSTSVETGLIGGTIVYFMEIFTSDKISENAQLTLQLRDEDIGRDDLLIRKSGPVNGFLGDHKIEENNNFFSYRAFWRNEYEDEE